MQINPQALLQSDHTAGQCQSLGLSVCIGWKNKPLPSAAEFDIVRKMHTGNAK